MNLDIKAEQAPNAASTITLGSDLDAFGLRKIRVNWQLSAHDKRSIRRSTELIAEEFGRLDLGRTDPITFLPNRQQLDADQVYWTREPATLVLVTLADARAFNEILRALGHARSDEFIRAVMADMMDEHQALPPL